MNVKRRQKLSNEVKPWAWAEAAVGTALLLSLVLGPRDTSNPVLVVLLGLTAAVNATRNVKMYGLMDEYERSLMLRAIAVAFIFLMVSVFLVGTISAFSHAATVSPLLLTVLFLGAHIVLGVVHYQLQRREASEQ